MATILESLKGISSYPIPLRTIVETAGRRGLSLDDDTTQEVLNGKTYNLTLADLLLWLSFAPNVSQGGQSYSFTDEQRLQFRNRANSLYQDFGASDDVGLSKPIYGYKGSRL
jgi:hypothetical protein